MTGAELRAWRERLGKGEAWVEAALTARHVLGGGHPTDGPYRRRCVEVGDTRGGVYVGLDVERLTTAYRAALEAEERAQAERGPVEPVCPEGVTLSRGTAGTSIYLRDVFAATVTNDGKLDSWGIPRNPQHTPDVVEFAAAFMRYRAAQHAASDKQRKLDAVKAAEEAHTRALHAERDATAAREATRKTLDAARREAGL